MKRLGPGAQQAQQATQPSAGSTNGRECWCIIGTAPDDGLWAFLDASTGYWHPMVTLEARTLSRLRMLAEQMATRSGRAYRVAHFVESEGG